DNVNEAGPPMSATLLLSSKYRCVWFDPVATVFVPASNPRAKQPVDFAARHFEKEPLQGPSDPEALAVSARALRWLAESIVKPPGRPDRARSILLMGVGQAWRVIHGDPSNADAWKQLGLLERLRELSEGLTQPGRFRAPYDPVADLPAFRARFAL